jgi:hypothetical protein
VLTVVACWRGVDARAVVASTDDLDNVPTAGKRYRSMGHVRVAVTARLAVGFMALALSSGLLACVSRPERAGTPRSTAAHLVGVIGYRWRVTEVGHGAEVVRIPRRRGAHLALTADGSIAAYDSLNPYFGSFTPTAAGYHVTVMMVGLAGYVGHDPMLRALIDGIAVVTAQGADVAATLAGDRLDLVAGSCQVTATRAGPEPIPSTPSPTYTRS